MSVSICRIFNLAALAAFVGTGLMQAGQATFHLPVTVHWGHAVLAAGDYRMSSIDSIAGEPQFLVTGAGKTVFEVPLLADIQNTSNSSYLRLRKIDGVYYINEFSSGPTGKVFSFSIPKESRHEEVTRTEDISLPVAGN